MICEIAKRTSLLNKVYGALQVAAYHESNGTRFIAEPTNHTKDKQWLITLKEVALIKLREYICMFLSLLNLQRLNHFLGKDIVCFGDAVYIIRNLQLPIIAQMCRHEVTELFPLMDCLTGCCEDFSALYTGG